MKINVPQYYRSKEEQSSNFRRGFSLEVLAFKSFAAFSTFFSRSAMALVACFLRVAVRLVAVFLAFVSFRLRSVCVARRSAHARTAS